MSHIPVFEYPASQGTEEVLNLHSCLLVMFLTDSISSYNEAMNFIQRFYKGTFQIWISLSRTTVERWEEYRTCPPMSIVDY